MSPHNSGTLRYAYSPINFLDTPKARRIVASISAQHARRAAAHQSVFQSVPHLDRNVMSLGRGVILRMFPLIQVM